MGCGESKRSILAGLNCQVDLVKSQRLKFQQEIDEAKKEHEKHEAEQSKTIKNLNDENQDLRAEKSRMEIQLKNLDPKADIVRSQLHSLEAEYKTTKKELKHLSKDLKEAENEKEAISSQYKEISEEINVIIQNELVLQENIENLGDVEGLLSELNNTINRLEQEVVEKEKNIQNLEEKIKEKEEENKRKEELKIEISEVLLSSENESKVMQAVKDEIVENEELKRQGDEKSAENQGLEQTISSLEITQEEIESNLALDKEIERLTRLINETNETHEKRENLANKLQETLAQQNLHNSAKNSLENEITSIQEEIDRLKREKEEALNNKLTQAINELSQKIAENNENYGKELQALQEELDNLQQKLDHRREKRNKKQQEINEMREELERIENSPKIEEEELVVAEEETPKRPDPNKIEYFEETKEPVPEPAQAEPEYDQIGSEIPQEANHSETTNGVPHEMIPTPVRYEVPIKLRHLNTGHVLHSHPVNYHGGSNQQEVTCHGSRDDNDWWIIKGVPLKKGEKIKGGKLRVGAEIGNTSCIILQHLTTKRNLHSHAGVQSPSSHQQEVTCYGDFGKGDSNDYWKVEIQGVQGKVSWISNMKIRLIHINTQNALHSHGGHFTQSGQQEVTCYENRDDNDLWVVETIA
ncbi:unnamed protein product [Blepharisma stoltei]|uniref:MIR domain-containing protein n=1 Tax=Blepharisma stoltei TaxID=1481888 RepID=A0AAU9KEI5_9CILI|nr:unnamed protein product [Blepharisma stoltei]